MILENFIPSTLDTEPEVNILVDTFIAGLDNFVEVNPIIIIGESKHMTHVHEEEEGENNEEEEILGPQRHIATQGSLPIVEVVVHSFETILPARQLEEHVLET